MAGSSRLAELLVRTVTAIVYAAVMLGAILVGGEIGLAIVMSVAAMLAAWELSQMTRRERRMPNEIFGIVASGVMPIAAALAGLNGLAAVAIALLVASFLWHVALSRIRTADTAITVFGAMYVGFGLGHFVLIRALPEGVILALITLLGVWANDVFAYLVGSAIGKHKMTPRISPNKSWEGFAAGVAGTTLVWIGLGWFFEVSVSTAWLVLTGLVVSVAAVAGDLFESRLKREAGVKDSGTLLPGHGGFLDRFDSLIVVSVVAYYMLLWGGA